MATITVPEEVGIQAVGLHPDQPQFSHRSGYTGESTSLLPGPQFFVGNCEIVDLSTHPDQSGTATGISQILRFLSLLEGSANPFELPVPDRIVPWAQPEGTAAAPATATGPGTVTLAALPNGLKIGGFVRVGSRLHFINEISTGARRLSIRPVLDEEYAVGVSVSWGLHSVLAKMDGDPSDLVLRASRRRHPSRVTVPWYEVV